VGQASSGLQAFAARDTHRIIAHDPPADEDVPVNTKRHKACV